MTKQSPVTPKTNYFLKIALKRPETKKFDLHFTFFLAFNFDMNFTLINVYLPSPLPHDKIPYQTLHKNYIRLHLKTAMPTSYLTNVNNAKVNIYVLI